VEHYAAIDISLELSSVCIVDAAGKVVKESKVETHPEALAKFFKDLGLPLTLIGLEAGPLSQWLHTGLIAAGFEAVRMGWFRPVHAKSVGSQEVRALLVARKLLQHKLIDIEMSVRGILRGFGLKIGKVTKKDFESRRRDGGRGEGVIAAVGRHLTNHAVLDCAHHFPPFLIASCRQGQPDHGEKQVTRRRDHMRGEPRAKYGRSTNDRRHALNQESAAPRET